MTPAERAIATFTWDGKPLPTFGELLDAANQAERDGKAAEFLAAYRAYAEHADENLGYLIGYMGDEDRQRMYAAYGIKHPIFGAS